MDFKKLINSTPFLVLTLINNKYYIITLINSRCLLYKIINLYFAIKHNL